MLDLSIIIVNWNTGNLLKECLGSIRQNLLKVSYEVIVVDNHSTDDSLYIAQTIYPEFKYIKNEQNVGFAVANNQALRETSGEYILLLNPDTILLDSGIETLVDVFRSDQRMGILGCRLRSGNGQNQVSVGKFPAIWVIAMERLVPYIILRYLPLSWRLGSEVYGDTIKPVDYVSGACLMLRRKVYDQIGGLDERFFAYFEETDFCYRARKSGWVVASCPWVTVVHFGGQSFKKWDDKGQGAFFRSLLLYSQKHGGSLSVRVVVGILLLSSVLHILKRPSRLKEERARMAKYLAFSSQILSAR